MSKSNVEIVVIVINKNTIVQQYSYPVLLNRWQDLGQITILKKLMKVL